MQERKLPDGKFRDRLEMIREQRGFSPADLARLSGLTPTAISRYRSGERTPNAEELLTLAWALDVTMEWLLTGEYPDSSRLAEDSAPYHADTKRERELRSLAAQFLELATRLVKLMTR